MSVDATKRIDNLLYEVQVSGHKVLSDVPVKLGGKNSAPDPHDYLLASLAACTIITMQMYANRKGIPLESADVKVRIEKEGAENVIVREIQLNGELSAEQRQRLFEIAEKCPIHNFLERGAEIKSELSLPQR